MVESVQSTVVGGDIPNCQGVEVKSGKMNQGNWRCKSHQKFGLKKRKEIGPELEGVRDYMNFVLLFILLREIIWEYGQMWWPWDS